jgi:hypothetical protein
MLWLLLLQHVHMLLVELPQPWGSLLVGTVCLWHPADVCTCQACLYSAWQVAVSSTL